MTAGKGKVVFCDSFQNLIYIDTKALHFFFVENDLQLLGWSAPDFYAGNPVDAHQRRFDRLFEEQAGLRDGGVEQATDSHDMKALVTRIHPTDVNLPSFQAGIVVEPGVEPVHSVQQFQPSSFHIGALVVVHVAGTTVALGNAVGAFESRNGGKRVLHRNHDCFEGLGSSGVGKREPGPQNGFRLPFGLESYWYAQIGNPSDGQQGDQCHYYGHGSVHGQTG
jgi:hypothetical protein